MRQLMKEEEYAKALEVLAEMIQLKDIQPEFLYDGAYAYFMLGDYERAAQWVNNVLSYDKTSLKARTLLGRICILEDRVEDGLAIFEYVLDKGKGQLPDEMQEEIEDVVSYYVRQDPESIRQEYPCMAEFMEERKEKPAEKAAETPAGGDSPRAILQALKEKVIGNTQAGMADAEAGPEKSSASLSEERTPVQQEGSAKEILRALRDKMLQGNAGQASEVTESREESARPEAASRAQTAPNVQAADDARQKKQMIMQQNISLEEKVRALNAFAGELYYRRDLAGAKELLTEALHIDAANSMTVKNMAYVLLEQGEKEKALTLVTQAKAPDFALIRMLRNE